MIFARDCLFVIQLIAIRQSPVNNSQPVRTIIIRPTGKTTALARRERPTFKTAWDATLPALAPKAIIAPASTAFTRSLEKESLIFPSQAEI